MRMRCARSSPTTPKGKTLACSERETVNVLGVNLDIALAMGLVGEISK